MERFKGFFQKHEPDSGESPESSPKICGAITNFHDISEPQVVISSAEEKSVGDTTSGPLSVEKQAGSDSSEPFFESKGIIVKCSDVRKAAENAISVAEIARSIGFKFEKISGHMCMKMREVYPPLDNVLARNRGVERSSSPKCLSKKSETKLNAQLTKPLIVTTPSGVEITERDISCATSKATSLAEVARKVGLLGDQAWSSSIGKRMRKLYPRIDEIIKSNKEQIRSSTKKQQETKDVHEENLEEIKSLQLRSGVEKGRMIAFRNLQYGSRFLWDKEHEGLYAMKWDRKLAWYPGTSIKFPVDPNIKVREITQSEVLSKTMQLKMPEDVFPEQALLKGLSSTVYSDS